MRQMMTTYALLICLLALAACKSQPTCTCQECPAVTEPTEQAAPYRHVVAFKFKDTTTQQQIEDIVIAFAELEKKIDAITGFEYGKQVSAEGFDQGYTHVFIVSFDNKAGLDTYLPHPAHKAFVDKLLSLLDPPPFVVDYVAE